MDLSRNGDEIVIRTPFCDAFNLIQVMDGIGESIPNTNHPVNFRLAALQRKGHADLWHADRVLAFTTDESTPFIINGEDIGGNHGHPCGVRVMAPNHGKTCRDVGSLWRDEADVLWTLLRVDSPDQLLFISPNTGPCKEDYAFLSHVTGRLDYVENGQNPLPLCPRGQSGYVQLTRAIRRVRCEAAYQKDGTWREAAGTHEDVREARITEEYEVINPATVAEAVRKGRPPEGYAAQPSLDKGEAMLLCRTTYHVLGDGTVLCDFDHTLLQPMRFTWYLGIMYQEKCDLYGGGVWRYIPKLRPFTDGGVCYDFSTPRNTVAGPMPRSYPLTPDTWTDPLSPPDRQIDLIAREDGTYTAAFAGGFLPCFDGAPEKRRENITDAGEIVASGKTYPTFAGGKENMRRAEAPCAMKTLPCRCFQTLRGVAYRKYLRPEPGKDAIVYDIFTDQTTYVFMDFFSQTPQRLNYLLVPGYGVKLLEQGGDVTWHCGTDAIEAEGKKGYAVYRLEKILP